MTQEETERIWETLDAIKKDIAEIKTEIRICSLHIGDTSIHERSPCQFARELQKDMNKTVLGATVAAMLMTLGGLATVLWHYIR